MRVKGATVQQVMLGLALLAALCWNLARASEIKQLSVETGAAGTRAELSLDRETAYQVISLANPDRLVVDLPGVSLGRSLKLPAPAGLIKSVRTGHPVAGTTRIVFDLAAPVVALKPRFEPGADGARLVLEWPGDNVDPIAAIIADVAPVPRPTQTEPPPRQDPTVASSAATSRLIANLPPVTPSASNPASPPQPQPTSDPSLPRALPTQIQTQGTIATGVPTRIATGVPAPAPESESALPAQATTKTLQDAMRRGMRPLVIAIDPGHGGQDPGAVGLQGKREKDVTLSIARELARQINATPGLKAYLTRDTDVFIPLPRRAQLARAAKADMFVSIHADAAENRSAKGSSVYVLSLRGASSQRARWLADKENAADLIGGVRVQSDNTLTSVLLDLTQSGHMKASEDAASHVLSGLKRVGNNHKPNIERANFAVLRTSDMPAMLVETAFISNPEEERRLTDPAHQRTLARAVLDGINTYFTSQPPPGTLYAARANAGGGAIGGGGGSP
jgi:N-acetylmuramoyl-L-alanine amidase